ncbi:MAG: glycosyltransferase family 2 protein [Candidatus Methylomirabilia bacterium]
MPRVSIVIPAFNEEASIGRDLTQVREAMAGFPDSWELIVTDDGSTDRTGEIAREIGATVLRHEENRGTGAARKTGIRHARGEIVVMTDADGTYPNDQIPQLLQRLPDYDQVIGARRVERGSFRPIRSLVKSLMQRLAGWLTGTPIPDLNSGLRAFKREVMARYLYLIPDGFSSVSTMTLVFLLSGHRVLFVPIDYYPRVGRSKFRPVRDTYWYFLSVIRLVAYFEPLPVFMPLALTLIALGLLKSTLDFFLFSTLQESDIILILGGIILGAIAILADTFALHRRRDE